MNLKKNDNNYARVYCRFDQLLHTYKDKKKNHKMYEYRNRRSRRKVCDNIFQHFHELFLHTVYKTLSTKKLPAKFNQ